MLRLSHRLIKFPVRLQNEGCRTAAQGLLEGLKDDTIPKIIADDVYKYLEDYSKANAGADGSCQMSNEIISNLAPPFDVFFIESNVRTPWPGQHGWYCLYFERLAYEKHLEAGGELLSGVASLDVEWKWALVICTVFFDVKDGVTDWTGDICNVFINKDGKQIGENYSTSGRMTSAHKKWKGEDIKRYQSSFFLPAKVSINFMNCRNVELVDVTDTDGPSAKWLRRQRQPRLKYQTIVIDPGKKTKKRKGRPGGGGSNSGVSRHICRGHFKTYKPEDGKGLFGRGQYGTFWVPSHKKGDTKFGETITTYEVKAPA